MRHVVSAMLVIAAVIHIVPLVGVVGSERLAHLYGIPFDEPNLEILMRHRAVLFGLLGVFLAVSAFRHSLQLSGLLAGFVSVLSFLWLASIVGEYNAQLHRVVNADRIALACLVLGAVAYALAHKPKASDVSRSEVGTGPV